jgi:mannose-6-phosphate isomerase-like protein (cupin superfamily)
LKGEENMSRFNGKNSDYHTNSSQRNYLNSQYPGYKVPFTTSYKGRQYSRNSSEQIKDYGPYPFAVNINEITKSNNAFRTALWTGDHLQLTLMSLLPGEDIGLEIHEDLDQFIRIEQGTGLLMMGDNEDAPSLQETVFDDSAFIIPAGTYHNLVNIGTTPLKLYSIYAPPQHPFGTVQETKAMAQEAEENF